MAGKHCPSAGALPALLIALTLIALAAMGCGEDNAPTAPLYLEQSSPANVLANLQTAWGQRDVARYMGLLADDFQFYSSWRGDPPHLPVFWTRLEDSTEICALFNDADITGIRVGLQYGSPQRFTQVGRDDWRLVEVTGGFVEVDCGPTPAHLQGQTRRFELGRHNVYFRRGFTAADTDTVISETARNWYIVEWDDLSGTAGIGPARRDSLRCRP